ncbi:hypothetical protein TC41_1712 [Alicyclobacillus acidocaldarius subsp. acidocaldarius Tc-4-1]|uniref:Uncharacterized protein n=1 Tax=Alicyclobacillus acidocaldarius (strain Tc-4-1) TaxID=1048834 RepID=F8IL73_ALIAT|nr:hypothetical protein TC41_1712 [Alicyclobacillus acidocaldarius subsp. acidocaldarius Tc-4-1]
MIFLICGQNNMRQKPLAYAWVVAAYLEEKGVRIKLRPTVDALAKLQSFIRLPDGQIVAN